MGREIRRVDADWEHPKHRESFKIGYHPMSKHVFDDVFSEWVENYNLWKDGKHPDQKEYPEETKITYWE